MSEKYVQGKECWLLYTVRAESRLVYYVLSQILEKGRKDSPCHSLMIICMIWRLLVIQKETVSFYLRKSMSIDWCTEIVIRWDTNTAAGSQLIPLSAALLLLSPDWFPFQTTQEGHFGSIETQPVLQLQEILRIPLHPLLSSSPPVEMWGIEQDLQKLASCTSVSSSCSSSPLAATILRWQSGIIINVSCNTWSLMLKIRTRTLCLPLPSSWHHAHPFPPPSSCPAWPSACRPLFCSLASPFQPLTQIFSTTTLHTCVQLILLSSGLIWM